MSKETRVTVVIPNYNGIQYLKDCLDSVLKQTVPVKVIVVDNGSKDGSVELLEKEYPSVLLLKFPVNTGFCHAVNAGLHLVQTPYAFLLNNDTKAEPDCIGRLLAVMEKNPRLFAAQALMLSMKDPEIIDDAGDLVCALGWAFARAKGKAREKAGRGTRHIFAACAGAALYRMSVFDEIGWFDERHYCYLEDVDIGWRAQIYGHGSRMEPSAAVYHAGSATSGSRYNEFKELLTSGNSIYLLYKNMPFLQYWINAPLWKTGIVIKRKYFSKMGLGDAFRRGMSRGEYLRAVAADCAVLDRYEIPHRKGAVAEEALVENGSGALEDILPIYLGGKVPFEWKHLVNYVSIEGQLIAGCFRRLCNG